MEFDHEMTDTFNNFLKYATAGIETSKSDRLEWLSELPKRQKKIVQSRGFNYTAMQK